MPGGSEGKLRRGPGAPGPGIPRRGSQGPGPRGAVPVLSPLLSPPQTERAYQKQPTIFQNKKRVLLGEGGKEKLPRYYRNVGLGFKTPKEVRGAWAQDWGL